MLVCSSWEPLAQPRALSLPRALLMGHCAPRPYTCPAQDPGAT